MYVILQGAVWKKWVTVIGREDLLVDPDYATPEARLDKIQSIFDIIEEWTMTKDKFEVMDLLNPLNIPCGPVLSMKEIADDPSLR